MLVATVGGRTSRLPNRKRNIHAKNGAQSADHPALLCLLCADPIPRDRPPLAVAVLNADVPSPVAALACGICASCRAAHRDQALQSATLAGLRSRFGLSIRLPPPFSPAGHA
jgi:hypothetical protein